MRKQWIAALLSVAFVGPAMLGCDKKVEETKTMSKDPNTGAMVEKKDVSTTQGGGTKTEETSKTVNP